VSELFSVIETKNLIDMVQLAKLAPKEGCFVEVGVYKGGSAKYLYDLARESGRLLHLFDTFTGIPMKSGIDFHQVGDFGDVDVEALWLEMPNAIYHMGVFPETLKDDLNDIAFIHADVDQYETQKAINKELWPRVRPGGIMLIDDYTHLRSINTAMNEDFPEQLQILPGHKRPFLRKALFV
jgi:O-methyltransferase